MVMTLSPDALDSLQDGDRPPVFTAFHLQVSNDQPLAGDIVRVTWEASTLIEAVHLYANDARFLDNLSAAGSHDITVGIDPVRLEVRVDNRAVEQILITPRVLIPRIHQFRILEPSPCEGRPFRIAWNVENAASVRLRLFQEDTECSVIALDGPSGELDLTVEAGCYRCLLEVGSRHAGLTTAAQARSELTLSVRYRPPEMMLRVDSAALEAGECVVLRWRVEPHRSETVSLRTAHGAFEPVRRAVGTLRVPIFADETVILEATDLNGEVQRKCLDLKVSLPKFLSIEPELHQLSRLV
ncbi:MAG: hypothetical protein KDH88_19685 [Chromatiales bacterium]|nr:hypothetical protein [Chromatiales bacterium]